MKLRIEGELSRGGDYLYITDVGKGRLRVEMGHQCVVYMHHDVPVEFLTLAIANALHGVGHDGERRDRTPKQFVEEALQDFQPEYRRLVTDATSERIPKI